MNLSVVHFVRYTGYENVYIKKRTLFQNVWSVDEQSDEAVCFSNTYVYRVKYIYKGMVVKNP